MLDEIIDFVVERIAFAGEAGAPIEDFAAFVGQYFEQRRQETALPQPTIDDTFIEHVWRLVMEDSPIHVVFPAPTVPSPSEQRQRDEGQSEDEDDEDKPKGKGKKRKTNAGTGVFVGKGQKKLGDEHDIPMYEVDDEDRALSFKDLQAKFTDLHMAITFDVCYPILTGTYEKLTFITDTVWKNLLFVASGGIEGVAATAIGKYFGVDQKKVEALCRKLLLNKIIYKRKAGGKGVTMNYIYHKAFWDTEQDRPKVDVEGQRVAMETDVMTLQDLSNVPLVEARILKALEDEGAVLQSMLFNAMGVHAFRKLDSRRLRNVVNALVDRGAIIKGGAANSIILYPADGNGNSKVADRRPQAASSSKSRMSAIHPDNDDDDEEEEEASGVTEFEHIRFQVPLARQMLDVIKESGTNGIGNFEISRKLDGIAIRTIGQTLARMVDAKPPPHLASERIDSARSREGREEKINWYTEDAMRRALAENKSDNDDDPDHAPESVNAPLPDIKLSDHYTSSAQLEKALKALDAQASGPVKVVARKAAKAAKAAKTPSSSLKGKQREDSDVDSSGPRGRPRKKPLKAGEETYYARKKREAAERAALGLPPLPKRGPEGGGRRPKQADPGTKGQTPETNGRETPRASSGAARSAMDVEESDQGGPVAGPSNSVRVEISKSTSEAAMDVDSPAKQGRSADIDSGNGQAHISNPAAMPSQDVTTADAALPKKKRGRPPKAKPDASKDETQDDEPTPKRKRGRPRKQPLVDAADSAPSPAPNPGPTTCEDVLRDQPNPIQPPQESPAPQAEQMQEEPTNSHDRQSADSGSPPPKKKSVEIEVIIPTARPASRAKKPETIIRLADQERKREVFDFITSIGGIVDFTGARFSDRVAEYVKQKKQDEGSKDKVYTMDRLTAERTMDRLVDDKKLRTQTIQVGESRKRRQIYYLSSIDPDGQQFRDFVANLQIPTAGRRPRLKDPSQNDENSSTRPNASSSLAQIPQARLLDEPNESDPDEVIQGYFQALPKIFGARFGAFAGKYAQMRVLHGFMFDQVEKHETGMRFDISRLITELPLRTFLYIIHLPHEATQEVEAYLKDSNNYRTTLKDLPQNVKSYLGLSTRQSIRRHLHDLINSMATLRLVSGFEGFEERRGSQSLSASNSQFCVLSSTVPVYDYRSRNGEHFLTAIIDIRTRQDVAEFWKKQELHAIGRGGKRLKKMITSDLFPTKYDGDEAVDNHISTTRRWDDSSSLRNDQRILVRKALDSRENNELPEEDLRRLSRLMYANEEAVRNFIKRETRLRAANKRSSDRKAGEQSRKSAIAPPVVSGQAMTQVQNFFGSLMQGSRAAAAPSARPSASAISARRRQKLTEIRPVKDPAKFFGEYFDWSRITQVAPGRRIPRNTLSDPRMVDTILDAAVILRERADRLNKQIVWGAVRQLVPEGVDFDNDKVRSCFNRATQKPADKAYYDALYNAWKEIWTTAEENQDLPDPNPWDAGQFDLGQYITYLRERVDKKALRAGLGSVVTVIAEDRRPATTNALPLSLSDAATSYNIKREDATLGLWTDLAKANALERREKKFAGQGWTALLPPRAKDVEATVKDVKDDVAARHAKILVRELEVADYRVDDAYDLLRDRSFGGYTKLRLTKLTRLVKAAASATEASEGGAKRVDNVVFSKKWHDGFKTIISDRVLREMSIFAAELNVDEPQEVPFDLTGHDGQVALLAHLVSAGKWRLEVDASYSLSPRQAIGSATRSAVDQDIENTVIVQPPTGESTVTAPFELPSPQLLEVPRAQEATAVSQALEALERDVTDAKLLEQLHKAVQDAEANGVSFSRLFEHDKLDTVDGFETLFKYIELEPRAAIVTGVKEPVVVKSSAMNEWTIPLKEADGEADDEEARRAAPVYWLRRDGTFDQEAWSESAQWVRGLLTTCPGLTAAQIVERCPFAYMLSFVEVKAILEAFLAQKVLKFANRADDLLPVDASRILWHSARWFVSFDSVHDTGRLPDATMDED